MLYDRTYNEKTKYNLYEQVAAYGPQQVSHNETMLFKQLFPCIY
jgi:hypothetical protein